MFLLNLAILPANAEEADGPYIGTAGKVSQSEDEVVAQDKEDIPEGLLEYLEGIESLPEILKESADGLQTYETMDFECKPEEWQVLYLTKYFTYVHGIRTFVYDKESAYGGRYQGSGIIRTLYS